MDRVGSTQREHAANRHGAGDAILGAFSQERSTLRIYEISRRTGLSVSTTHRLVTKLAEWGALARIDEHVYRIGR